MKPRCHAQMKGSALIRATSISERSLVVLIGVGIVLVALVLLAACCRRGSGRSRSGGGISRSSVRGGGGGGGRGNSIVLNGGGQSREGAGRDADAQKRADCGGVGESLVGSGVLVCLDAGGKIFLVLSDLGVDLVSRQGGLDVGGGVDAGRGVDLLDSEAATKGTGLGVVTAANSADIAERSYRFKLAIIPDGCFMRYVQPVQLGKVSGMMTVMLKSTALA